MKHRYYSLFALVILCMLWTATAQAQVSLTRLATFTSEGDFDDGGTEIIAYDAETQRVFSTNGSLKRIDVIDISDPTAPTQVASLEVDSIGDGVNSVAVGNGLVAAAVENEDGLQPGFVVFFGTDGSYKGKVQVGTLPDMVTFTHDGTRVLVANEGEPGADYSVDPEGTISIITLPADMATLSQSNVTTLDFHGFDDEKEALRAAGVRIFGGTTQYVVEGYFAGDDNDVDSIDLVDATGVVAGMWFALDSDNTDDDVDFVRPYQVQEVVGDTLVILTTEFDYDLDGEVVDEGTDIFADPAVWTFHLYSGASSVSEDLEPEYIAVSPDDNMAWVTLQENNAVAIVDLTVPEITEIRALGTKDHSVAGNGLDATDNNEAVNISTYNLRGMYMPDAITAVEIGGSVYYLTANEGDAREYDGYIEEYKVEDLVLDASVTGADLLQDDDNGAGDLATTLASGDTDGDGDWDVVYSYGARSFTVWNGDGLVWDSGDDFEQITAERYPDFFNSNNDNDGEIDDRSDNKGPEPEAITTGVYKDTTYAFIGLERMGGIMVYRMLDAAQPEFVTYVNYRDFAFDDERAGDLGPEDLKFIPVAQSPTDTTALVLVSNEVSGTITIWEMYSPTAVVSGLPNEVAKVRAYPNPATDRLTVAMEQPGAYTVTLVDMQGRPVVQQQLVGREAMLRTHALPKGMYVLQVSGDATAQLPVMLR